MKEIYLLLAFVLFPFLIGVHFIFLEHGLEFLHCLFLDYFGLGF